MNIRKALQLIVILVLILTTATGCDLLSFGKERKIKNLFNEKLKFYPVKNLDDYYHLTPKGEYTKNNIYSGEWILLSNYSFKKREGLYTEGAILHIDIDKKLAKGKYYKNLIYEDKEKGLITKKTNYKIIMKNNHLKCIDDRASKVMKEKIENFKFISQYANFKKLKRFPWSIQNYNYTLNSFFATRELSNEDEIVKYLRNNYDIKYKSSPYISMSGNSKEFKQDNNINIDLEITFNKNNCYFSDAIIYKN